MTYNEYNNEIANKFAARLGLLVAGFWSVSFLIVVLNFPSYLSELGYMLGLLSIFIVGMNLRQARKMVMPISWLQGFVLCLKAFMGGILITTLVQFIYFAGYDHGHFINSMLEMMKDPAMKDMLKDSGNNMQDQIIQMLQQMSEMTPRVFTMNLMTNNLIIGFIFALISSMSGGKALKQSN